MPEGYDSLPPTPLRLDHESGKFIGGVAIGGIVGKLAAEGHVLEGAGVGILTLAATGVATWIHHRRQSQD